MRRRGVAIGGFQGSRGQALARSRRMPRSRRSIVLVVLGVVVVLAMGGVGARWLLTSPGFAVIRVESGAYRFSSAAEVDEAMRFALGRNIWTLPTEELSRRIAALPWVRSVSLRRRVPDTVAVELQEWRPLVSLAPTGQDRIGLLIGDGRVLPQPEHLPPPGLPVLVGGTVTPAGVLEPSQAAQLMPLLDAMAATGFEAAFPVDFIRLTPEGVILELARGAGRLRLGREDFDPRLRRYLLARDRVPHGAMVDLRFADRITYEPPVDQDP